MFSGASLGEVSRYETDERGILRRRRERRVVAGDRLEALRRCFVPPRNLVEDDVRRHLKAYGAVVLLGDARDGLRTIGQMLLVPRGQEGEHDIREDLMAEDASPWLDVGELRGGERLLLDLTGGDASPTSEIMGGLEPLRGRARRAGAWLVVLLAAHDENRLPAELRDHVVRPGRPDPLAVFERHLDRHAVPGFFPEHAPEPLRLWADHASMREVEGLARRVAHAYRERGHEGRIDEWIGSALGGDRDALLAPLQETGGRERAILLAASLLEGASVERLSAAVERLLPMVRSPEDGTPPIERPPFQDELSKLGLKVDPDRHIRFRYSDQAAAIRAELWDGHPWLHEALDRWADGCVRDPELSPADRDRAAERWAEQALRVDRPAIVLAAVREWGTDTGRARDRASQSAVALSVALKDTRYGSLVRNQVYRWGSDKGLPPRFAQVLIAVCADELAITHPERALVRLHLFAAHNEVEVGESARSALMGLAGERSFHRRALRRLTDKLRERDAEVDRALFWELTRPGLLLRGPTGRSIAPGLLALVEEGLPLMLTREPGWTRDYGELWIGRSEQFAGALVNAAARAGTLASLYTTVLRPARSAETRGEWTPSARDALLRRIDVAQGLRPSTEPEVPREENT
ncbi:hypothetical protein DSY14_16655 [Nocardiopsis sp. MG754419]|nr:hypothetical protein [Nocardiopsis sp. MG754419]